MIVGRESEIARLAEVISAARDSHGGALLIEGEAGVGKSHLVDAVVPPEAVRLRGIEAEHNLPYAAVNLLTTRLRRHLDALSPAQREAVDTVSGRQSGPQPPALVLGSALLAVLAVAGDESPLIVVVDDLQWVDRSSRDLLLFVARRLEGESVAMVFTARTQPDADTSTGDLPRIVLEGLSVESARALLPRLRPTVTEVLVERTGGNPLALLEAAAVLSEEESAGIRALPATIAATTPEEVYGQRLATLDPGPRRAARLAALAGDAPSAVLFRALALSGLTTADLGPVEALGLLSVSERTQWRHPLARSAAARGFAAEHIEGHRTLAVAWHETSPQHPARAWHLAEAAQGPEAEAAAALRAVAELAESRGGSAEAAEAFARAASLSQASPERTELLERAGVAATRAGATRWAAELLDEALIHQSGEESIGSLLHARARIEFTLGQPEQALELFFQAVDISTDRHLRVWAATEAVLAAMFARRPDLAERTAALASHHHDPSDAEQVFLARWTQAVAARFNGDQDRCRSLMDDALALLWRDRLLESNPALLLFAVTSELHAERPVPLRSEEVAALDRMRLDGDLTWLPRVVRLAGVRQEAVGNWAEVYSSYEEAELLSRLSGQTNMIAEALLCLAEVDAYQGAAELCRRRLDEARDLIVRHHLVWQSTTPDEIEGLLVLGLGDVASAAELFRRCLGSAHATGPVLSEIVDALRLQDSVQAARTVFETHLESLAPPYHALGSAITTEDDVVAADGLRAAARMLGHPWERGRWLLSAGERLRRAGERRAARADLREAADLFSSMSAAPWLARAEAELRASGATLRRSPVDAELTPSEQRIARLVTEGRSNKEVAAVLYLSPKTVEFHLGRIYRKLEVENRTALARRLG